MVPLPKKVLQQRWIQILGTVADPDFKLRGGGGGGGGLSLPCRVFFLDFFFFVTQNKGGGCRGGEAPLF